MPSAKKLAAFQNILIIAHPDDEAIFFYDYVKKYKPFVLCLTNGDNLARRLEFMSAMRAQEVEGVMLNFRDFLDEPFPERELQSVLLYFLSIKSWDYVATHNDEGEYGHIHHIQISAQVRNLMRSLRSRLLMPPLAQELETEKFQVRQVDEKIRFLRKFYRTQARHILSNEQNYRRWVYFEGMVPQSPLQQ